MKHGDVSEGGFSVESALERGFQDFMGLRFKVKPGVLIPRKETELLARTAIEVLTEMGAWEKKHGGNAAGPLRVVDMCCGAGNIACSIAARVPDVKVWASDLTEESASLAAENVQFLGLSDSVAVFRGRLFSSLPHRTIGGLVDVVVCNPPYISSAKLDLDLSTLHRNEPREAFDGGPYGHKVHQEVSKEAVRWLRPGGALILEFGAGQRRQLEHILERTKLYKDIQFIENSSDLPGVVTARI